MEPNDILCHEAALTPEEQSPAEEWEPEDEMERRCSGSYAESQARLARTLLMLVELAERRGPYGAD